MTEGSLSMNLEPHQSYLLSSWNSCPGSLLQRCSVGVTQSLGDSGRKPGSNNICQILTAESVRSVQKMVALGVPGLSASAPCELRADTGAPRKHCRKNEQTVGDPSLFSLTTYLLGLQDNHFMIPPTDRKRIVTG